MMEEFIDKVALITGAGRGIGREVSLAFASLGALVAVNDINPLNLDETVNQILQAGGSAKAFISDTAKRMPVEAMVNQVMNHFGHIDVLVNHARVKPEASILEMDEWEFHRTIDVNLGGPFFTMQQIGRVMQEQGGGSIVNLITAFKPGRYHRGMSAYIASQLGLVGLTQEVANELIEHNIRVNAVCQRTSELDLIPGKKLNADALQSWLGTFPELYLGDHPTLVGLVLYVCSQAASSLSGQVFMVDNEE